jgi:hypothetical protein
MQVTKIHIVIETTTGMHKGKSEAWKTYGGCGRQTDQRINEESADDIALAAIEPIETALGIRKPEAED